MMLKQIIVGSRIPTAFQCRRCLSLFSTNFQKESSDDVGDGGWFSKLLGIQSIEPMKQSHSSMLADKDIVYEIITHDVQSGEMNNYLQHYETFSSTLSKKSDETTLVGSWRVIIGNNDQAVHIWRHGKGYPGMDQAIETINTDSDLKRIIQDQSKLCHRRESVVVLPFSFWKEPVPRAPKHIYELRSYTLKPGTMIEWGNNWARGIQFRRDFNQDVAGFFSQIGHLYMVFHLWAYKDLSARKHIREETWRKPGWDTNVAYTVPLIKKMECKIMVPNSFSAQQ